MNFRKSVSLVLIAGQMGFVSGAFAASSPSDSSGATPEMTLLENIVALEGAKLPQNEMQTQFSSLVMAYAKSAPAEGQQARMEQAMIRLNLYTPEQSHALTGDVESASQALGAQDYSSPAELSASLSAEISNLATNYPAGAQFSACTAGYGLADISASVLVLGIMFWGPAALAGDSRIEHAGELLTLPSLGGLLIAGVIILASGSGDSDCW